MSQSGWQVHKFGGTSLTDTGCFQRVADILVAEPADRQAAMSAGDVLTQLEALDYLRRHRQLSVAETQATIASSLHSLLS